jgi:hypothetical protein
MALYKAAPALLRIRKHSQVHRSNLAAHRQLTNIHLIWTSRHFYGIYLLKRRGLRPGLLYSCPFVILSTRAVARRDQRAVRANTRCFIGVSQSNRAEGDSFGGMIHFAIAVMRRQYLVIVLTAILTTAASIV